MKAIVVFILISILIVGYFAIDQLACGGHHLAAWLEMAL